MAASNPYYFTFINLFEFIHNLLFGVPSRHGQIELITKIHPEVLNAKTPYQAMQMIKEFKSKVPQETLDEIRKSNSELPIIYPYSDFSDYHVIASGVFIDLSFLLLIFLFFYLLYCLYSLFSRQSKYIKFVALFILLSLSCYFGQIYGLDKDIAMNSVSSISTAIVLGTAASTQTSIEVATQTTLDAATQTVIPNVTTPSTSFIQSIINNLPSLPLSAIALSALGISITVGMLANSLNTSVQNRTAVGLAASAVFKVVKDNIFQ